MLPLFAADEVVLHVPVGGLIGAAGSIAASIIAAAKILAGYWERRDKAEADARAQSHTEVAALRAENVGLFKEQAAVMREVVEKLGALQHEIARAAERLDNANHNHEGRTPRRQQ